MKNKRYRFRRFLRALERALIIYERAQYNPDYAYELEKMQTGPRVDREAWLKLKAKQLGL